MTKRIIDLILSILVLAASLPFLVLILIIDFLILRQFPIIVQKRKITLEKNGIKIFKIRTVRNTKRSNKLEESSRDILLKKEFKEYVPWFCCLLRNTGLDDLLQLINVIKGEMSLVGPRPLLESDLMLMEKSEPEFYYRRTDINSLPGISGNWQVYGDRSKGFENLIELDEDYEKRKSFLFDMRIIFKSFLIILTASHSDSIL